MRLHLQHWSKVSDWSWLQLRDVDYFKNNLKHFPYNLTFLHILCNFLIMKYSYFSSSVMLFCFSSSFS